MSPLAAMPPADPSCNQDDATPRSSSRPSRPTEDPVMAAYRCAPQLSPEETARYREMMAEVKSQRHDPSVWLTEEQFMAKFALGRRVGG